MVALPEELAVGGVGVDEGARVGVGEGAGVDEGAGVVVGKVQAARLNTTPTVSALRENDV